MIFKRSVVVMMLFFMLAFAEAHASSAGEGEKFIQRYEKFIPFDYYPGLDSKNVAIGQIVAVDGNAKTVTIRMDGETHHYEIRGDTSIWLNELQFAGRNLEGSFSDLKPGLKAEIQTNPEAEKRVAKWIKVQISE